MTNKNFGKHEAIARAAALDYAESPTVGALIDTIDEGDSTTSYIFASSLKGYQGWRWAVTLFEGEPENPTLSEVMLLPGEESLVAPAWVPWSERLADWKALQAELEAQAAAEAAELEGTEGADEDSEDDSDDDSDDADDKWSESADAFEDSDEENDLEHEEKHVLEEVGVLSVEDEQASDSALADLEPGEDAQGDTKNAGNRPPRFALRNRRWGKKKDR
jgi:hypothetical protein